MFRFTIRDLLWLMVVVGMALGWIMDRLQLRKTRLAEQKHIYQLSKEALINAEQNFYLWSFMDDTQRVESEKHFADQKLIKSGPKR
jgi:hypothetical protein